MAKQKIVIKVEMASDKCRSKAMALVAATDGVLSVAIAGEGKDQVVVVGEGVDSIKLTSDLRKKVGAAHLMEVGDDKKKADDNKKPADPVADAMAAYHQWLSQQYQNQYQYQYPPPIGVVYDDHYSRPGTCSIM